MSVFAWYVLILTLLYVIYYGVLLAWDQYGVKGHNKDVVEEFDGLDGDASRTRVVTERDGGGYNISDETVTDSLEDEETPAESPEVPGDSGWQQDDSPEDEEIQDVHDDYDEHQEEEEQHDDDFTPPSDDEGGEYSGGSEFEDEDEGSGSMTRRMERVKAGLRIVVPTYDEEFDSSAMEVELMLPAEHETCIRRQIIRM